MHIFLHSDKRQSLRHIVVGILHIQTWRSGRSNLRWCLISGYPSAILIISIDIIGRNHSIAISKAASEPGRAEASRDLHCPASRTSGARLVTRTFSSWMMQLNDTLSYFLLLSLLAFIPSTLSYMSSQARHLSTVFDTSRDQIRLQRIFLFFTSLHFTSLHFTSLHFTSLHFILILHSTSLYFISLHSYSSLHFTSLCFISFHSYSSLHFISFHSYSSLHFSSFLFFTSLHFTLLHFISFLFFTSLHFISLHSYSYSSLHFSSFLFFTSRYFISLHSYTSLHFYSSLHFTSFHFILILHFTSLHFYFSLHFTILASESPSFSLSFKITSSIFELRSSIWNRSTKFSFLYFDNLFTIYFTNLSVPKTIQGYR